MASAEFSIDIQIKERGGKKISYNYKSDISGAVTLEQLAAIQQEILIQSSKEFLRENQREGFDKNPRRFVDNKAGLAEEMVRPFGKIEYLSRLSDVGPSMLSIYDEISRTSIVGRTGFYKATHLVFFRDKMIAQNRGQLKSFIDSKQTQRVKDGDVVRFVNAMPYARKLELSGASRGKALKPRLTLAGRKKDRKKGIKTRKPNGTYWLAYKFAKRSHKGIAKSIAFEFLPGSTLGLDSKPIRSRNPSTGSKFRTRFKKDGRPYLYPSIKLIVSSEGINTKG